MVMVQHGALKWRPTPFQCVLRKKHKNTNW